MSFRANEAEWKNPPRGRKAQGKICYLGRFSDSLRFARKDMLGGHFIHTGCICHAAERYIGRSLRFRWGAITYDRGWGRRTEVFGAYYFCIHWFYNENRCLA